MSIQEQVQEIVVEQLGVDPSEVRPDRSFIEDLNADSLDLTELIMTFEERFGLDIDEETVKTLRTVGDVINYVQSKKG